MKIPEGIYRLEEPGMAAFLFSGRREVMIDACLQGMMGCVYGTAGGMDSAAAVLGDFCFLAGNDFVDFPLRRQYNFIFDRHRGITLRNNQSFFCQHIVVIA